MVLIKLYGELNSLKHCKIKQRTLKLNSFVNININIKARIIKVIFNWPWCWGMRVAVRRAATMLVVIYALRGGPPRGKKEPTYTFLFYPIMDH